MQEEISLWPSYTARNFRTATAEQAYRKIIWGAATELELEDPDWPRLRRSAAGTDPRMFLEYACFHGVFEAKCRPERLVRHSGLIAIDCEGVNALGMTPAQLKQAALERLDGLTIAYETPSGDGVRLVVKAEPAPRGPRQHVHAFLQLAAALEQAGLKGWNSNGADLCSRSPLSFDPKAIAPNPAKPFRWQPCEEPEKGPPRDRAEVPDKFARQPANAKTQNPY